MVRSCSLSRDNSIPTMSSRGCVNPHCPSSQASQQRDSGFQKPYTRVAPRIKTAPRSDSFRACCSSSSQSWTPHMITYKKKPTRKTHPRPKTPLRPQTTTSKAKCKMHTRRYRAVLGLLASAAFWAQ